jgi:hypothetical protein
MSEPDAFSREYRRKTVKTMNGSASKPTVPTIHRIRSFRLRTRSDVMAAPGISAYWKYWFGTGSENPGNATKKENGTFFTAPA